MVLLETTVTLSLSEIVGISGIIILLVSSTVTQWIWTRTKFAEAFARIAAIEEKNRDQDKMITENRESDEKDIAMLSREFSSGQQQLSKKIDNLLEVMTDVRIKCASHDGVMKTIEKKMNS